MDDPILTSSERAAINAGRWFSSLSPHLRHDILRCAHVKHYKHGELIAARGDFPDQWMACAEGAVRVCSASAAGKQVTLTYVQPGVWFGDVAMFDGDRRTHDVYAHGLCTLLCVASADLRKILATHPELYEAMLRLQARRIRLLFELVEDLHTLNVGARLAKHLAALTRSYGIPSSTYDGDITISLHLAQEDIARLISSSRQRVNEELQKMIRKNWIRIEQGVIVVRNLGGLMRFVEANRK